MPDLTAKQRQHQSLKKPMNGLEPLPCDYEFAKAGRFRSTVFVFKHAIASTTHPRPSPIAFRDSNGTAVRLCLDMPSSGARSSWAASAQYMTSHAGLRPGRTVSALPISHTSILVRAASGHFLSSGREAIDSPLQKNETSAPASNSKAFLAGSMGANESLRDERGRHFYVADAVSTYQEFTPPASLREQVLCIWTQTIATSRGSYSHLVLPDACVDIVCMNDDAPLVVGPWTESFVANLAAGTTIVGVRFHPGRAPSLLGVPAHTLLNQSVPLDAMSHSPLRDQLSRMRDQPNLAAKRSALEAGLLNSLPNGSPIDQAVSAAIGWLARETNGDVQQLGDSIGLSSRQLQRRFSSAVGYGPKTFHSILRFQRVLYLASGEHNDKTLADLALQAGYADQAHMSREVRRFSGTPPKRVLGSSPCTLRMCDFLGGRREVSPNDALFPY